MLALAAWNASLCSGCGHPKGHAWHPDNDGWYDAESHTCWACSAAKQHKAEGKSVEPVEYVATSFTRDLAAKPYPTEAEMNGGAT